MDDHELVRQRAKLLKTLGNPIRLCIVKKLCDEGECNVSSFISYMGVSQSSVSQHLAKLRDLGILGCHKDGQTVFYFIQSEDARSVVKLLFKEERRARR